MRWWQRLDPRLFLAAAIGWSVFTVVTVAALLTANLAAGEAESRVRADTDRLLTQFATQVQHALVTNLQTHASIVQATATQIVSASDRSNEALRQHLEAVQAEFPEFVWFGVADARGRVVAATGGLLEGDDVSARSWFQRGRGQAYLGEIHRSQRLEQVLPRSEAVDRLQRFIDVAVPLTHAGGANVGVLRAQLSWTWIERLQDELLRSLDTHRSLQLLLADPGGNVIVGPPEWLARPLPTPEVLAEGGAFLVGAHADGEAPDSRLRWTAVVRQDAVAALAPARATRRTVFLSVLAAGLVAAAAAVWATRVLTRRLAGLAAQAVEVRSGLRRTISVPDGQDEVSRIGATLAEVVEHLQREKQALATLNAELDARVHERTARIERLADETRHAAVTRERLRLARELHDTLAHSMMAVLTQIRLVRKLRDRLAPQALEAELERAEGVAASGLTEARAAITQMRHNDVRDTGLVAALDDLLTRFSARSGVATSLLTSPGLPGLADERAETVFRIVEEALHNVERHAQARSLTISIAHGAPAAAPEPGAGPRVRIDVADDGVGFDAGLSMPGHYGLRGITEQAALIGARLDIRSCIGQGTRVSVEFDA